MSECVYTRAECHHQGTKCSECPLTDLICDEFTDCLDLSYQQGRADKYQEIISEYMLFTPKQIEEIRADVIEEFGLYEQGRTDGAREFAEWCEEKGYFDDYDSHTADNLLSWWQKGAE